MLTSDERERRRHPRLCRSEKLFLQIIAPSSADLHAGFTVFCATSDVSATGLRVHSECDFPAGCLLELWAQISDRPRKFFLRGQVRWSAPEASGGGYELGIEIRDDARTDVRAWHALFAERVTALPTAS